MLVNRSTTLDGPFSSVWVKKSKPDLKILVCMCLCDCWCIILLPSSPKLASRFQQPEFRISVDTNCRQLGYGKHLWLNLWSSSERERQFWNKSSNSSTTAASGTEVPNLSCVPEIYIQGEGSEGPESLQEEHKNKRKSIKIKECMQRRSCLWFYFCFPPETS